MEHEALQAYKARIAKANNAPDLRFFLTTKVNELRDCVELRDAFTNQIDFLNEHWAKDKFFKEMVSNLLEDFEIEMNRIFPDPPEEFEYEDIPELDEDEVDEILKIDEHFNVPKIIEKFPSRKIVEIRFLSPCANLLKEVEIELYRKALIYCSQNRTQTAKMLGVSIRTLRNKLNEYQENGYINLKNLNDFMSYKDKLQLNRTEIQKARKKVARQLAYKKIHEQKREARKYLLSESNQKSTHKPFKYATHCEHKNDFEWWDGLCFKCWQEREKKNGETQINN